ncbi:substrate-binding domain-containing protein [Vibrio agarivorans]|uniref:Substrate-binding domain-containing protein n=1 Tax=Vibrio agarivorans TaxID=153622 RepID=A0ABT7Y5N6_9VIBR|nr:substrate-binding domain-containing protein [Vibrio agarivorans]MDN2483352.1 substrate-binding domain-containing protein [Vibrio agarivorans]
MLFENRKQLFLLLLPALFLLGMLTVYPIISVVYSAFPLVTLGRADGLGNVPSVQTDNQMAGKLAAEHLLGLGCKRLGYLAGRRDGQASIERWQGFSKVVCAELGTAPQILEAGRYGYSAGFETAVKSTEALRELDGVFCASDALALGLVDACQQFAGINIPNQLRVVGCDNVPQAAWQGYQLTTVAQPVKDIAVQALQALENIGREHSANKPIIRVKPFLKVRKT